MADNNRRPYQTRDTAAQRSSEAPARPRTDDPLAELARLIGQKGPIDDPGNGRNDDERYNPARDLARDLAMAMRTTRSAQPAPNPDSLRDDNRGYAGNRAHRDSAEPGIFPSRSADGGYEAEGRYEDNGHYEENTRYEEDTRYENNRYRDDDRNSEDARYAADNRYERDDQSEDDAGHQDGHDDYNEDGHDYADDHAYADDEAYADGDYEDGGRKRGGFVFVAIIFALAVLGTAGAFGYRAIFGSSIAPALPPIIKAEDGPNKIIPTANAQSGSSGQADATNNDSNEKLVSREEQPVNIGAPPSANPRMVSTVPVFPDSAPGIGPGSAAAGYSIGAMGATAGAPPTGGPAFAAANSSGAAATAPTGSVPTPPPADRRPTALNQTAPSAPAPTVAPPAPPATKKIHTVAIRTEQSDAQDATSSAQRAAKPSSTADANAPLSIVPSGGETAAPAAPAARPHSAPARAAPVNTAAAATTDAPAPASAGGGYAVQVSSQRSEAEVQDSFRALQAKYPDVLGGKQPIIRRADLGAKGIYYRALVGPFASSEEAASMCSSLKAAGGSCLVQKN